MDEDGRIFGEAYKLYDKWRHVTLETEEHWANFAQDVLKFADRNNWRENALTNRLALAIMDAFNDMYKDGQKPPVLDYFGRSDL